jgi:hypothetical protein
LQYGTILALMYILISNTTCKKKDRLSNQDYRALSIFLDLIIVQASILVTQLQQVKKSPWHPNPFEHIAPLALIKPKQCSINSTNHLLQPHRTHTDSLIPRNTFSFVEILHPSRFSYPTQPTKVPRLPHRQEHLRSKDYYGPSERPGIQSTNFLGS